MTDQFSAHDMATAASEGFRAGQGSIQTVADGRWYMVNRDGMATLCADREDAEKEAADAQSVWPHMGPHRAVQLAPAGDMAKLRGQRMVLCSLLGECLPVIDALMQIPGDDDGDARLNGLAGRITGALNALAEDQVKGGES